VAVSVAILKARKQAVAERPQLLWEEIAEAATSSRCVSTSRTDRVVP
jgi:hypothetical protein